MPTVNSLNVKIGADITAFNKGIEDISKKLNGLSSNLKNVGKTLSKNITAPLLGLSAAALKVADDDKRLRNEFIGLTGSIEGANDAFERFTEFSRTSPFKASQVAGLSKALIQMSGDTETAFQRMDTLQKVAAATGASMDFLGDRMLKIAERGKVDTRSFERMALNGIPAAQLLAENMGITTQRVKELADEGQIGIEQLMTAFRQATGESGRFAGAMDRELNTIAGAFNNIRNRVEIALGDLGVILTETFDFKAIVDRVGGALNRLVGWFKGLSSEGRKTVLVIAGIAAAIGPATLALGAMVSAAGTLAGVMAAIVSPVGLVVTALGALAGAVMYTVKNWEALKERVTDTGWWTNALISMAQFAIRHNPFSALIDSVNWLADKLGAGGFGNPFDGMAEGLEALRVKQKEYNSELQSFGEFVRSVGSDVVDWLSSLSAGTSEAGEAIKEAFVIHPIQRANSVLQETVLTVQKLKDSIQAADLSGMSAQFVHARGSINAMNREISIFTERMNAATDPAVIRGYADAIRELQDEIQELTGASNELGQSLQTAVTGAIQDFATTIGNAFTGDAGASGFFNNLLIIVADFGEQFGKALIAAGLAAQAFQFLLTNPLGAVAAGTALIAASTAVKNLLTKGPAQSVNDALITSDGRVIEFHPDDNILAMKDLSGLTGGAQHVIVEGRISGADIHLSNERGQGLFR